MEETYLDDTKITDLKKEFEKKDEARAEVLRGIPRLQRGILAFHWRTTNMGRMEHLRKLVTQTDDRKLLIDLINDLSRVHQLIENSYNNTADSAKNDHGLCKEVVRQIHKAREMARERKDKAKALATQVEDLKLNEGKRKAQFYELHARNEAVWKTLTEKTIGSEKAAKILETVMNQPAAGDLWEKAKDCKVVTTLLIIAVSHSVAAEEHQEKINNQVRILDSIKKTMKEIAAIKDFDDVERRTYGHMANRIHEIVKTTRSKIEAKFEIAISQMQKKSKKLQRLLNRFENERLALIQAQRMIQIDILSLLISDNDYLKNAGEMVQEFVGKPMFFEFRQLTDSPSAACVARVNAARKAAEDNTLGSPIPDVEDVKVNVRLHLENANLDSSFENPASLKVVENDVNFFDMWKIHIQRQEVLRALEDRLELTGLVLKAAIERISFITATRTEAKEDTLNENGNIDTSAIDDPWCQYLFTEDEIREFIGQPIFNSNRDFLK